MYWTRRRDSLSSLTTHNPTRPLVCYRAAVPLCPLSPHLSCHALFVTTHAPSHHYQLSSRPRIVATCVCHHIYRHATSHISHPAPSNLTRPGLPHHVTNESNIPAQHDAHRTPHSSRYKKGGPRYQRRHLRGELCVLLHTALQGLEKYS